jgi:hypothetical protein
MIHQLLLFWFYFLQGITLKLMLKGNKTLFSIAQCSMSYSKPVLGPFQTKALLQYTDDLKFWEFAKYWVSPN